MIMIMTEVITVALFLTFITILVFTVPDCVTHPKYLNSLNHLTCNLNSLHADTICLVRLIIVNNIYIHYLLISLQLQTFSFTVLIHYAW